MRVRRLTAIIYSAVAVGAFAAEPNADDVAFFETKIRPLLVETCYKCHSVSEKKSKGGLYVDSVAALLRGGETGAAIVPGKPEKSKLIEAVTYKNADLQMPPKGPLSAVHVADLTEWVKRGAAWPKDNAVPPIAGKTADPEKQRRMAEHWSFQAIQPRVPPKVKNKDWAKNEVDRFVLAKLDEKKLKPAPVAEKRALIRRATFDLIGLPPTPAEIDAFLIDKASDAFEKVIDRLLASPHYGERWARHWLDVARYADSNGMDENHAYANAYRYRDYVVAALNKDKPYDQFVREQLAGDLMPVDGDNEETMQRQIATGFMALGPKVLAEPDPKKMEMDIIDEQLDTTGRAFMGLTFGCARCHDHKFDPLPTADYYSLAAIFKSTRVMENFKKVARWYERPLASKEEIAARDAHENSIKQKKQEIENKTREGNDKLLAGFRTDAGKYLLAAAAATNKGAPAQKEIAKAKGLNEKILAKWIEHVKKSEAQRDPVFFAWNEFRRLPLEKFSVEAGGVMRRIAEKPPEKMVALSPAVQALFAGAEPASFDDVARRYAKLFADVEQSWRALKETPEGKDAKKLADVSREALRQILYDVKNGPVIIPEKAETLYPAELATKINSLKEEMAALEKSRVTLADAMGAAEGDRIAALKIHIRGNPQTLGAEVPKRFPRIIAGDSQTAINEKQSGRLQFAEWLTRKEHPLTSRVMVNRIWRWHFGGGIVNTPDNFGLLGEMPSHPELLDWLAAEFVEKGWSIKHMHRLMMRSATYQMSVVANEKAELVDPENRLRWRMDRRRLEAEVLRDSILAVSGELDLKLGGSVMTAKNRDYINNDSIQPNYDINRRSLYLPVIRNAVFDVFQAFDFPDPNVINGNRASTTVAPQALFMINGKLILDKALKTAEWLLKQSELDDAGRVRAIYLKALSRQPTKEESARALDFVQRYSAALEKNEKTRVRAWQGLCQVILASNEFIYTD